MRNFFGLSAVNIPLVFEKVQVEYTHRFSEMPAKLLVVDDEAGILEEVKAFFEEEGFQVFTADSGEEGIQILKREKPDVMLLDMKLPDMSGLLVLKVAKESSPLTKVIVNTGYVSQSLIDQAQELGRDVFMQKPFDLTSLSREVDRLLNS